MARYALVIGVATYDKFPNLPKATTDAEAVARVLEQHGNFYKVERHPQRWVKEQNRYQVAPNKRVTADEMFGILKDFLQDAQNQEVLIYFAGHGFRVSNRMGKQRGFLATSDSLTDGRNAIPLAQEFNLLLSQSNLSSLVVLLDCCHAGALLEANLELNRNLLEPSLSAFESPRDYYLMTACRAGELAREEGEHGLFTGAVLEGLSQENADPATGQVSVNRLFEFVYQRLSGSGQEPFQLGGGRSLILVSYPPQGKKESSATAPVFSSTKGEVASGIEPRILAFNLLKCLLPTQFDEVIFRYGVDESQLPMSGTQVQKAIDVIKFASQKEGQSLFGLLDLIAQIAPHSRPKTGIFQAPPLPTYYVDRLPVFYGRKEELTQLSQWLVKERSQLVVLRGMGGIGKTSLAVKLLERVWEEFECIIWRSLSKAPLLQELLAELSEYLSDRKENEDDVSRLIEYLRRKRCLIVLDDLEEIMWSKKLGGNFREEYQDYGDLLIRVAQESHQSCLLLLSRENPSAIEQLGKKKEILKLEGLPNQDARQILNEHGISCTAKELEELIHRYKGNPYALYKISPYIKELCNEDISCFLKMTSVMIPEPMLDILYKELNRLSDVEEALIYWIAILGNSASIEQIRNVMLPFFSGNQSLNGLMSLKKRRSLVDDYWQKNMVVFSLPPVIRKYIIKEFVKIITEEILAVSQSQVVEDFEMFRQHAIITFTNESFTQYQERLIVDKINERLSKKIKSTSQLQAELIKIANLLQESSLLKRYAYENTLVLISHLENKKNKKLNMY